MSFKRRFPLNFGLVTPTQEKPPSGGSPEGDAWFHPEQAQMPRNDRFMLQGSIAKYLAHHHRPPRFWLSLLVMLICASSALVLLLGGMTHAQNARTIVYGATVEDELTNRFGHEWRFQGCQEDVITVTVQSNDFVPFLELYDGRSDQALIEGETSGALRTEIAAFPLDASGSYTIFVAGSTIRDRGLYSLTLSLSPTTTALLTGTASMIPPDVLQISSGQSLTNALASRLGDEWLFRGCASDVVTVTMESGVFTPFLELYGPTGREPLTTSQRITSSLATITASQISRFTLPDPGIYTLIAVGENLSDRGPYTLSLAIQTGNALTGSVAMTTTPTSTPTSTVPVTVTPSMIPPGTIPEATPTPTASPTASPTSSPTATPTSTPTPTPTATEPPTALQPQGIIVQINGGAGDLEGDVYMDPAYLMNNPAEDNTVIVRDRLSLELYVYDPAVGEETGAGIERVEFYILCPNGEEYFHSETSPRYCSFGGGEPNCNLFRIELDATLPGSACVIEDGEYVVEILAIPRDLDLEGGNWNFTLIPDLPFDEEPPGEEPPAEQEPPTEEEPPVEEEPVEEPTPTPMPTPVEGPPADIVAHIAQIGSGSRLIFQVEAYDPDAGNQDGAGIAYVDFEIVGPNGTVYTRREMTAHYCAFGGGEPNCDWFDLAQNTHWPDGSPIEAGQYQLRAFAVAHDGRSQGVATNINIQEIE